ncbi:LacI family DNA-binding transcriptional regulator [Flammeovirgaceae bacterium SG7u.111]|nr:LacI family DNA-binding transcriptional regulator [Flammeovirgaceae bacterium SG7u.132]WPO37612.1 LacI family DNA-binding transcriptional regulator [Flammeovirgaceae bacterium SG7u.111]
MRSRVKITDLAEELGVSPSTISRALSGDQRISSKTRNAVFELAERWGYNPNPFAINLLKNKSNNIGLILPEFTHHYFSRTLFGIEEEITKHGYHLLINTHNGNYEKEVKASKILNGMMVDGLLVSYARHTTDFDHYKRITENGVPVVFFDRLCEDLEASYVITDDFPGAKSAIDYLVKTGCKKIAHFKGPENLSTSFTRKTGYIEGLKRNELPADESLVFPWNEDHDEYLTQMAAFMKEHQPDGVFCFSDYIAYDALITAQELNIKVPDELSIIGFANEPISNYSRPQISTVSQPAEDMGKRAAEILIWHIDNPESEDTFDEMVPTELVLRQTTKKIEEEPQGE